MLWRWLRFPLGFIVVVTALILFGCMSGIDELTIVVSMLAGWVAVIHTYIEFEGRMTWRGDLIFFLTLSVLVLLPMLVTTQACMHWPNLGDCRRHVASACLFAIVFPMGLSSITLWGWFRWRQRRGWPPVG